MTTARARKLVVAGLVRSDDGSVLLSQRRADQAFALQWELPGGKMEPGESPEQALARELAEELDIHVSVERIWDVLFHAYPEFDLVMLVYGCRLPPGEVPRCREVEDFAWVPRGRLHEYDILPADRPLIERLATQDD
jgi:8-oxo-dGTP diphosphatase